MTTQMSIAFDNDSRPQPRNISSDLIGRKTSVLRTESYGFLADRIDSICLEQHEERGYSSFPLVIGHRTLHAIPNSNDYFRWEVIPGFKFEIVTIDEQSRFYLAMTSKIGKYFILAPLQEEVLYDTIAHVDKFTGIKRLPVYRYCLTDSFIAMEFKDVLEYCESASLRFSPKQLNAQTQYLPFRLTGAMQKLLDQFVISTPYTVSLQEFADSTLRVSVKYEQIIGGFTLGFIDSKTITARFELAVEGSKEAVTIQTIKAADKPSERSVEDELRLLNIVSDSRVDLPIGVQLTHYTRIKSMLGEADAKYRKNGFDFKYDNAQEVIDCLVNGSKLKSRKKQHAFFATGQSAAKMACECLDIDPTKNILEPHGGHGALADQLRELGVEPLVNEIWDENVKILEAKGYEVMNHDFLKLTSKELNGKTIDAICANPPWHRLSDIDHFMHALELVRKGGQLSFLMSPSSIDQTTAKATLFKHTLKQQCAEVTPVKKGSFEGTKIGGYHIFIKSVI